MRIFITSLNNKDELTFLFVQSIRNLSLLINWLFELFAAGDTIPFWLSLFELFVSKILRWPWTLCFFSLCSPRSILFRSSYVRVHLEFLFNLVNSLFIKTKLPGLDMLSRMFTGSRCLQRLHSSSSFLHLSGLRAHKQPFLEPFVGFSIFSKHLFNDKLCLIEF